MEFFRYVLLLNMQGNGLWLRYITGKTGPAPKHTIFRLFDIADDAARLDLVIQERVKLSKGRQVQSFAPIFIPQKLLLELSRNIDDLE